VRADVCDRRHLISAGNGVPALPSAPAALKTHAVQTLRDYQVFSNRAERLECGAFTAAL